LKNLKINGLNTTDYGGNAAPLIFVHGFPLDNRMWNEQVAFFKNKFHVITYDVRGLGQSISNNNQFTMEMFANDLLHIIDHFQINKANVCGLSMGGYITLRALIKNPERFNSVILADTRAEKDDNQGLLKRSNVVTQIQSGNKEEFLKSFLPKLLNKNNFKNDKLRNFLAEMMNEQNDEGICGNMIAMATRTNAIDELNKINIPALIIVGEDDELTPLNYSKNMNHALNNSTLMIVPDSGHMSNLESTEIFNATVYKFLSKYT